MARIFHPEDAKHLTEQHKKILHILEDVKNKDDQYVTRISEAAQKMAAAETYHLLKGIPIEEINRDKRGFKIKLLREHGYHTIADISGVSVANIASIRGISEDSAREIWQAVRKLVNRTGKSVTIKLSADNKSAEASALVLAIAKYRKSKIHIEKQRQLLSQYGKEIDAAVSDLAPRTGRIGWFFASGKKKKRAEEAYDYLKNLLSGEYFKEFEDAKKSLDAISRMKDSEAWRDFRENSVQYFNILEKIAPSILGTKDGVYGLPEDLAGEIREQELFPNGLLCELRRYQEWGVKYILHQKRVLLGDEMGLGKTVQAIAAMVSLRNTGATHFVVVCPASVISNWCREIRKHSLLSVTLVHGAGRASALQSWIKTGGVAVTTYETTVHFELEKNFRFSMLVVDEAHYIKNPDAQRTIHVKAMGSHADRMLFMTGTALENKVEEMISLIRILQPKLAVQIRSMAFLSAAPQFREKVAPVYYRRKREDVLAELPDLIENREWCTLSKEEEAVYEQAVLSKHYTDARRVSWNVDDISRSCKARRMQEIIEEAEGDGRKVIVFSFFLDTIKNVCDVLGDKCMAPINGSVSPGRRQEIIDEFDKAPAGTVLAAQIQSGGTGLNIQSASVVIICEPQFKPSFENQAVSRAYRMGQTRNVLVYRLLCENTVDEKITELLKKKQKVFDAFADKSVAAAESLELDEKTFGHIIQEEIDRINSSRLAKATEGACILYMPPG